MHKRHGASVEVRGQPLRVGYLPRVPGTQPGRLGLHSQCLYLLTHLVATAPPTPPGIGFPLSHFDRSIMTLNVSSYFCSPTSYSFSRFQSLGNPHRHIQKRALQLPGHSSTQQGRQDYPSLGHRRFRGKGPMAASYRGLGTQVQVLVLVKEALSPSASLS